MRRRAFAKRTHWQRGVMNKGERAYAEHLDNLKTKGHILRYGFEASTWLIGPNCRLTPDFTVIMADGEMQMHEVKANRKGRWHAEDDAKVKMKAFVDKWPEIALLVVWPSDRAYSHWHADTIGHGG